MSADFIIPLLFGVPMVAGSLIGMIRYLLQLWNGEYYYGTIKDIVTVDEYEAPSTRYPVVEYQDSSGQIRTFKSGWSSDLPKWEIGDVQKVRVVRGKPYLHDPVIEGGALIMLGFCGLISIVSASKPPS